MRVKVIDVVDFDTETSMHSSALASKGQERMRALGRKRSCKFKVVVDPTEEQHLESSKLPTFKTMRTICLRIKNLSIFG